VVSQKWHHKGRSWANGKQCLCNWHAGHIPVILERKFSFCCFIFVSSQRLSGSLVSDTSLCFILFKSICVPPAGSFFCPLWNIRVFTGGFGVIVVVKEGKIRSCVFKQKMPDLPVFLRTCHPFLCICLFLFFLFCWLSPKLSTSLEKRV